MKTFCFICLVIYTFVGNLGAQESICPGEVNADPKVIFCDSFEDSLTETKNRYYSFDDDDGDYVPVTIDSVEGSKALRTTWQTSEVSAGSFQLHFGRNPLGSQLFPDEDFTEIYWRFYLKLDANFQDYPSKISRLFGFANTNWAQSMIAHVWHDENNKQYIVADPVSGIQNDQLVTTKWNDFDNFSWLGKAPVLTPFPKGEWVCIEAHVKLNSQSANDGIFEIFFNGELEANKTEMDWVGGWNDFGLNAILFSNYWGNGSPAVQSRYLDAFVVSRGRIGCFSENTVVKPKPPTDVITN